jgi:heme/copper-type cytochrome/quinol oxidase subunit 3
MCCIISKIGCDTHINTYHSNNKFHQYIILLMNCLGPLHIYKRVDKWNHEPHPLFIIRNTFPILLSSFTFLQLLISKIQKNTLQWENPNKTQKYLYFIVFTFLPSYTLFFCCLFINLFQFTNMKHFAWQPHDGVGNTRKILCFVCCFKRNKERFSWEFDINPRVTLVEKICLL